MIASPLAQRLAQTEADTVAELRTLARRKKLQPAPASAFPRIAHYLGVDNPAEDVRIRFKALLQEWERIETEEPASDDKYKPLLAKPALTLLGFSRRSEHKGIGERQRLTARLRWVAVSSIHTHEHVMAKELYWLLAAYYVDQVAPPRDLDELRAKVLDSLT
jgi:hypothetical protein